MKYTELLTEYVQSNGGAANAFPAAFDTIPDFGGKNFKELFLLRYCAREIGFETEELFKLRLEGKASEVCPAYVRKLANYDKFTTLSTEFKKTFTFGETNTRTPNLTVKGDGGIVSVDNYDNSDLGGVLPNPNALSSAQRTSDQSGTKTTGTDKNERGGTNEEINQLSPREMQEIANAEIDVRNIYSALLDEFEPLFMQVF